jgi:hypothetical protein
MPQRDNNMGTPAPDVRRPVLPRAAIHAPSPSAFGVFLCPDPRCAQFNLADFTRRAYGTNYVETLRVTIHANARIRRVYFSDRLYSEEETPPEFKLFVPVKSA